jgi:hypothetical protein
MESVRDKWTDERLDDLNHRVDLGFGEVRSDLRDIRREMGDEFRGVRQEIHALGADANERLDGLQRSIVQLAIALTSAFVAGFAAICALLARAL